jgi:hypothetical protein
VDARRTEKDDGVLNLLIAKPPERLEILRDDPDRPRLIALEKLAQEKRGQDRLKLLIRRGVRDHGRRKRA